MSIYENLTAAELMHLRSLAIAGATSTTIAGQTMVLDLDRIDRNLARAQANDLTSRVNDDVLQSRLEDDMSYFGG